ncbi:hypothetical protein DFJ73DRAFT_845076 [Zopfochytrium polystomum]|nr:hypothetical protein DFJ73DRAFT_845076 [Zopfochytrium polystomum]
MTDAAKTQPFSPPSSPPSPKSRRSASTTTAAARSQRSSHICLLLHNSTMLATVVVELLALLAVLFLQQSAQALPSAAAALERLESPGIANDHDFFWTAATIADAAVIADEDFHKALDWPGLVDVGSARGSDVEEMDGDGANDGPITMTTLVGGAEIDEEGFETVGAGKRNKKDQQERANILVTTAEKQISDPAQYTDAHLRQDTKAFYVSLSDEEKARHLVVSAYHPKDGKKVFFSTTVTGSSNGVRTNTENVHAAAVRCGHHRGCAELSAKSQEVRNRGFLARKNSINGDGGRFAAFGKVHDDTRPAQFVRACKKCQEFQQIMGATDCYVGPDGGITRRSSTACPIPKKPVTEDAETKSRGLSAPKNAIAKAVEKSPTDKAGKVPRTRDTAKPGSKQERGGPPKKSTERSKTLGRDKRGKSKATKAKAKKAGGRAPQSRKSRSKAAAFKARGKNGKATSKAGGKSGKVRQRKFETTQPSPKNGKGAVKRTPKMQGKSARPKGGKAAQKKPKAAATAKAKAAKAAPAVKRATGGGKARRFRLGDRR